MPDIDFDAHYKIDGFHPGIAFYLVGYVERQVPVQVIFDEECGDDEFTYFDEWETEEDRDHVIAVMVGDNRKHEICIEDLQKIEETEFCRDCGQIGCGHNVYE